MKDRKKEGEIINVKNYFSVLFYDLGLMSRGRKGNHITKNIQDCNCWKEENVKNNMMCGLKILWTEITLQQNIYIKN